MRRILLALLALLLFLPALGPVWGEDKTKDQPKEGGIIGTGVLGQITRLGSIYVNGLHIHFAPDMALVGIDAVSDLRPGMTVAATISPKGADWQANTLRRLPVLVGPVTGPNEVMGVQVSGAVIPAHGVARIDGFWTEFGVVATHVEPAPHSPHFASGPFGPGRLGTMQFDGIAPQHLREGDVITLQGSFGGDRFHATSLEKGLFVGENPKLVLAEGFLSTPDPSGIYRLIGAGLFAYTERPEMIDPTQKLYRCGWQAQMDIDPQVLGPKVQQRISRICSPSRR
jgi:hypothetical protein